MSVPEGKQFWDALPAIVRPAGHQPWTLPAPDAGWKPLRQHWLPGGASDGFQPGWAHVAWTPAQLTYDIVLAGRTFSNAARRLNELTWELGDVCEIFADLADEGPYIEIHITPENHRLQLRFPPDGIAEVRAGRRALDEFMVNAPDWVHTEVHRDDHRLHIRAVIPASALGLSRFSPDTPLRTAVCRYDYGPPPSPPVLSSTAALSAPAFHQRNEWSPLRLQPVPPRQPEPASVEGN